MAASLQTDSANPVDGRTYRVLLKNISDALGKKDILKMKFLCSDIIGLSKLEKINRGIQIIQELENLTLLSASDFSFLVELLVRMDRLDIVRRQLNHDPQQIKSHINSGHYVSKVSTFRLLLHSFALEIPQSLLSDIKFLLDGSVPRSSLENVNDVWGLFTLLESNDKISTDDISFLYEINRILDRLDLDSKLQNYSESIGQASHSPQDFQKYPIPQSYLARQMVGNNPPRLDQTPPPQSVPENETSVRSPVQSTDVNPPQYVPPNYYDDDPQPIDINQSIRVPPEIQPEISIPGGVIGTNHSLHQPPSMSRISESLTETSQSSMSPRTPGGTHLELDYNSPHVANQQSLRTQQRTNQITARRPIPVNDQSDGSAAASGANRMVCDDELPSYNIKSRPRGWCIIINNETFTHNPNDKMSRKLDNRPGTKRDEEKLSKLFKSLGFEVQVLRNKTADGIEKCMKKCSEFPHGAKDAFVACILSHGKYGAIYGSDGHKMKIDKILSFFKAQRCPSLAGKPKLFFVQACQGHDRSKAAALHIDGPSEDSDDHPMELMHNDADFLVGYATIPGCVSYRHEDEGTWYIELLVEQMEKLCDRHDVLSIMTTVSQRVTERNAEIDKKVYKQCPLPYSTLRKRVYLPHI